MPLCLYHMFDIILAIDDENKNQSPTAEVKQIALNLSVNPEPFWNQF